MKYLIIYLSFLSVPFLAQGYEFSVVDTRLTAQGKAAFDRNCAACHSHGYGNDGKKYKPAVLALQIKYKGALSPYIEERTELNADVLGVFIRNGVKSMPPFRKTEVSDADIKAIAAYIAELVKKAVVEKAKSNK